RRPSPVSGAAAPPRRCFRRTYERPAGRRGARSVSGPGFGDLACAAPVGWLASPEGPKSESERRPGWEPIAAAPGAPRRGGAPRAGRDPSEVRLVAVSKTHPPEAVVAAVDAGVADIGENRAVEMASKAAAVDALLSHVDGSAFRPVWHFLGTLQTGTVRHVA